MLRRWVTRMTLGRFPKFLGEDPWTVIFTPPFLPAEIIAKLKRGKKFATPQMTVVTDFETHRLWVNEPCAHYFTATEEAAIHLHSWGVPESAMSITAIPIHPAFSKCRGRNECLKRHGLVGDRPIVLQLSGGFGIGPIEKIYRAIMDVDVPLEIVVVSGRNAKLRAGLEKIATPDRHRTH